MFPFAAAMCNAVCSSLSTRLMFAPLFINFFNNSSLPTCRQSSHLNYYTFCSHFEYIVDMYVGQWLTGSSSYKKLQEIVAITVNTLEKKKRKN